jgi:hypothetical protein
MDVCQTGPDNMSFSDKSSVDATILKIPKERDSLHKFAISKMLGISDDEEDQPKPPKQPNRDDKDVTKLDENCNNLAGIGMVNSQSLNLTVSIL